MAGGSRWMLRRPTPSERSGMKITEVRAVPLAIPLRRGAAGIYLT